MWGPLSQLGRGAKWGSERGLWVSDDVLCGHTPLPRFARARPFRSTKGAIIPLEYKH